MSNSYKKFCCTGLALDPIHVGTGGARLGRVDLTIVRDPVTRVPKVPGSSLAGVYRTYVAMAESEKNGNRKVNGKDWPYYPHCAGLGQERGVHYLGHCGQYDCPVCTVFGFARGKDVSGGFAGLAAFTDAHVLLFPTATREGPMWVTSPEQLRIAGISASGITENAVYRPDGRPNKEINLGWLLLEEKQLNERYSELSCRLGVPDYILERFAVLPDKLFVHVVNSGLEVRTSVSINPETGAAEERALFSYEALPRSTVLYWEIICKNPKHFRISNREIEGLNSPDDVYEKTSSANPYLEHLGIGGMGTRGMGRLRVLGSHKSGCAESTGQQPSAQQPEQTQSPQQGGTP